MFDYRISKHLHFNEACRAFALRHNMAKLAERAGMNVQTLRNKLNRRRHTHDFRSAVGFLREKIEHSAFLADYFFDFIHLLP
nr:phage regulatory CII family protein [Enterobacter asburiae]